MNGIDVISAASVLGAAILIAGAAIGSGLGVGEIGARLVEGCARQPEQASALQAKAFIMAGALDAVPMMAVSVAVLLLYANPFL